MILKRLQLTNVRAFRQAEFEFQPGMNLLIGINGVGKSTVLDAIRILLSQLLPKISGSRSKALRFADEDWTIGSEDLYAGLRFQVDSFSSSYTAKEKKRGKGISVRVLGPMSKLKDQESFETQPLAVFFSPHRSILKPSGAKVLQSQGSKSVAYAEALKPRQIKLQQFIDWWLTRETLAKEGLESEQKKLDSLNESVCRFLDTCTQLRVISEPKKTLQIEKAGIWLDVRQLSDGERGLLAMVIDLTRRLAEANPELADPAKEGQAVVLIDELDLHLHPKWQRRVVPQLIETFPKCQFIATTHSPQIISEVQPDELVFLSRDADQITIHPGKQAYGLDTNWILEHLMGVPSRPASAQMAVNAVEDAIEGGDLDLARTHLKELRDLLHGDDGTVIELEASINTLEVLTNEVDTETD